MVTAPEWIKSAGNKQEASTVLNGLVNTLFCNDDWIVHLNYI